MTDRLFVRSPAKRYSIYASWCWAWATAWCAVVSGLGRTNVPDNSGGFRSWLKAPAIFLSQGGFAIFSRFRALTYVGSLSMVLCFPMDLKKLTETGAKAVLAVAAAFDDLSVRGRRRAGAV